MGLPRDMFNGEVGPDLICQICKQVFLEPATAHCGHIFCQSCIKGRGKQKRRRSCPICQSELQPGTANQTSAQLQVRLLDLSIKCSNKCGVTLVLRDLPDHVTNTCPNTPVSCPLAASGCRKSIKRCEAELHVEECDYRQVTCEACGKTTLFLDLFTHQSRTRCLERKLRQQVARAVRITNAQVRRHRSQVEKELLRLEQQQRKVKLQHARPDLTARQQHPAQRRDVRDDESDDVIHRDDLALVKIPLSARQGCDETGDEDGTEGSSGTTPHPSRVGHSVAQCRICHKRFHLNRNSQASCRFHAGPMVELFGGTCSRCGRLDYQEGCATGFHEV